MWYAISRSWLLVNAAAFVISAFDKAVAKFGLPCQRIPENALLLVSLFGGCTGLLASFALCNHKHRKRLFVLKVVAAALARTVILRSI